MNRRRIKAHPRLKSAPPAHKSGNENAVYWWILIVVLIILMMLMICCM